MDDISAMADDSYTVNSFGTREVPLYDENAAHVGVATINTINITYCIHGQQYTQDLMNLPCDDAAALQSALSDYVLNAKEQLAPQTSDLPPDVQALVEQTFEA